MAIATLPECRRPTCHELVAIGKNGEPLKDCETHRDKRPSAKQRAAAKAEVVSFPNASAENAAARRASGIDGPGFGAPRPAPKPTARQKANTAISARLAAGRATAEAGAPVEEVLKALAVPEPVVVLREDRNQVIVTLTATGSTDAQSKAKYAARAAGHKVTGIASISGGEAGSRKPSEWIVTLDLRVDTIRQAVARREAAKAVAINPALGDIGPHGAPAEPSVHTRFHKGSGKYLAEAKVGGKTIFRYGADAESAERKMREHLATL